MIDSAGVEVTLLAVSADDLDVLTLALLARVFVDPDMARARKRLLHQVYSASEKLNR